MATKRTEAPDVEIQLSCDAPDLPAAGEIERWISRAAAVAGRPLAGNAELSIRVVDEAESRDLNRRYRGKDRPTNVLAFPAQLDDLPGLPADDAGLLGDLVICAPVVAREAAEQGKTAAEHWAHMLVHGFLHLLGYDHRKRDESDTMEALETRILAAEGLENPYEDRYSN